jgi:hypothetical protein
MSSSSPASPASPAYNDNNTFNGNTDFQTVHINATTITSKSGVFVVQIRTYLDIIPKQEEKEEKNTYVPTLSDARSILNARRNRK